MSQQPMAYLNPEFLESAEARPIRILAEYLEPLRRFKQQKIQDTVVFFGSARVDSRERAERALAMLRARGLRVGDDEYQAELMKSRKALEWARYYGESRRAGSGRQDDRSQYSSPVRARGEPLHHRRPAFRVSLFLHAEVLVRLS